MKRIRYLLILVCLLARLSAYGADSLDIGFIDKLYVLHPQRAYRLLGPAYNRLQREGWKTDTREHYERVAGYVCLANNYYDEALRHALRLENLDREGKKPLVRLLAYELQANVMDELKQYEQQVRVLAKISDIANSLDDKDDNERRHKAFYLLYCEYAKISSMSNSGDAQGALREMGKARAIVARYQHDPDPGVRGNCAIMRHSLDELQGDIYIDHDMCEKGIHYVKEVLADLNREERRGGDEATDKAGYDIHRMTLHLALGRAYAFCGRKEDSLQEAAAAYRLWQIYPSTNGILSGLLGIYLKTGTTPLPGIVDAAEAFFNKNRERPSSELATICNNLLWLYTREGKRAEAERMLKEQERINQHINRENMEFYNVLSENSELLTSYYKQRVHKMVAAGIALALIILIIGMMFYHHQRLRDSEYIYKYVKLAASRKDQKTATGSKKAERNLVECIREVLTKDKAFLSPEIDYDQLERALVLKRRAIIRQLNENYHTTLKEIVTDLRLEYACQLLENTDYVLEFVATESAFGATRTFYRAFKNKYNLTPTEYRKLSKKEEKKG